MTAEQMDLRTHLASALADPDVHPAVVESCIAAASAAVAQWLRVQSEAIDAEPVPVYGGRDAGQDEHEARQRRAARSATLRALAEQCDGAARSPSVPATTPARSLGYCTGAEHPGMTPEQTERLVAAVEAIATALCGQAVVRDPETVAGEVAGLAAVTRRRSPDGYPSLRERLRVALGTIDAAQAATEIVRSWLLEQTDSLGVAQHTLIALAGRIERDER